MQSPCSHGPALGRVLGGSESGSAVGGQPASHPQVPQALVLGQRLPPLLLRELAAAGVLGGRRCLQEQLGLCRAAAVSRQARHPPLPPQGHNRPGGHTRCRLSCQTCKPSWAALRTRTQAVTERRTMASVSCVSAGGSPRLHTALCVLFPGNTGGCPNWEQLGHTEEPSVSPRPPERDFHVAAVLRVGGGSPGRTGEAPPSGTGQPPEGPTSTHSDQGLQRPSWPPEKVPVAQSTHSKPKSKFPGDRPMGFAGVGETGSLGPGAWVQQVSDACDTEAQNQGLGVPHSRATICGQGRLGGTPRL